MCPELQPGSGLGGGGLGELSNQFEYKNPILLQTVQRLVGMDIPIAEVSDDFFLLSEDDFLLRPEQLEKFLILCLLSLPSLPPPSSDQGYSLEPENS